MTNNGTPSIHKIPAFNIVILPWIIRQRLTREAGFGSRTVLCWHHAAALATVDDGAAAGDAVALFGRRASGSWAVPRL